MKTTLKIEGMSCEHCAAHVKEALEAVEGVRSAKVSLKDKAAEVDHWDAVPIESLKAAVVDEGYEVC